MKGETAITVDVRLNVTSDMAKACLALVAIYVNDTGKRIVSYQQEDGTVSFEFAEEQKSDEVKMEGVTVADISKLKIDKLDPELMDKIPRYTMKV